MGPRKLFAGTLVLTAMGTACPCHQTHAGVLISHPLAPDHPGARTPTAVPVQGSAVRHRGAASSAAGPVTSGGLGSRHAVDANLPASPAWIPDAGRPDLGGSTATRATSAVDGFSPVHGVVDRAGNATAAVPPDRRPANDQTLVNPAAQVIANPNARSVTSASPSTAVAAPVQSTVVAPAASSNGPATGNYPTSSTGTGSPSSATAAPAATTLGSATATSVGITPATPGATPSVGPATAPATLMIAGGATTPGASATSAPTTPPPGYPPATTGSAAPADADPSAVAVDANGASLRANLATPGNSQSQAANLPTTRTTAALGTTAAGTTPGTTMPGTAAPGTPPVSGAVTQAFGLALLNQALGWPQTSGAVPAATVASGRPAAASTSGTTSATQAASQLAPGLPKPDPLGAATGPSTSSLLPLLAAATLAPDPARALTPAQPTNLAALDLPPPTVDNDNMNVAGAGGDLAATPRTGSVLPAPVPEPSGFLVFGLAAVAYALRRRRTLTAASLRVALALVATAAPTGDIRRQQ